VHAYWIEAFLLIFTVSVNLRISPLEEIRNLGMTTERSTIRAAPILPAKFLEK